MQFLTKHKQTIMNIAFISAIAMLFVANADAANTLNETAKNWGETFKTFTTVFIVLFFAAGVIAIGSAGWDLFSQNKQGGQKPEMKTIIFKFVAGGIMVAVPSVAYYMKTNLVGEGSEELKIEEVNFGK